MNIQFTNLDWLLLCTHFMSLSLLAVGGAITTAPEMNRLFVQKEQWLNEAQFNLSLTMAQAAPGPNALYIALLGWHIGLNAAAGAGLHPWAAAVSGAMLALIGSLAPSSALTYFLARWGQRNRELRAVRAFKAGMAPLVIALIVTTGWLIGSSHNDTARDWPLWLLSVLVMLLVWKTRIHLLWLIGAGTLMGALGWLG